MDNRESWEIVYSIRVRFAALLVGYLTVSGDERVHLSTAYKVADIRTWAKNRIEWALEKAETERNGRTLSAPGRQAVQKAVEALSAAGFLIDIK